MARTVADAAALLGAMAGPDPDDRGHRDAVRAAPPATTMRDSSTPNGLKGARIGVVRNQYFGYSPAADRAGGSGDRRDEEPGAMMVDPANIPTLGKFDDGEFQVLLYEFKADLNKYLGVAGAGVSGALAADVIAFNDAHRDQEMPYFGQEIMSLAERRGR